MTKIHHKTSLKAAATKTQKNITPKNKQLAALFDAKTQNHNTLQRIAKRLAQAGLGSRRDAERWIQDGRIAINGQTLLSPAYNTTPQDRISIDGKTLALPQHDTPRLWRYYKPKGLIVTNNDEKGRPTIFDQLPEDMPRIISIGRLDMDSEGLLLLTNSGALARILELPETAWSRKYRVRVRGHINPKSLEALAKGLAIDGINYRPIEARIDHQATSNAWLTLILREGKNREIRKIMDHLGYPVSRLIRTGFGPFQLGQLKQKQLAEVKTQILRDQLGLPRQKTLKPQKPAQKPSQKTTQKRGTHANHRRQKTKR